MSSEILRGLKSYSYNLRTVAAVHGIDEVLLEVTVRLTQKCHYPVVTRESIYQRVLIRQVKSLSFTLQVLADLMSGGSCFSLIDQHFLEAETF